MATKSVLLPPKDEQQLFCHSDSDSQYSELNLNQNNKCSKIFPIQSKSKSINENDKHFSNSFIFDNQQKRKESSLSWNKSTTSESFNLYNKIDEKQSQKQWKKDINSNASNKSTLSLHIKAYENSVQDSSNLNSSKNVKIENKCLNFSSRFRNSFEFARQRENESSTPEVMQFKASQRLYNPNVTYNFNYSDLEKALDETLISLGLEDDVLSEASTTIENPIIKSQKLNHSVQTPVNRICNETRLTVGIDYEMCAETAAFEKQNVQEIFDHSITSEDPAFRDFLDKTHLTLGTDYEIASIAPTIEDQSFQQTFNRSTNFEITTNSFFGGFNETEDILKNFDDDLDGDDFGEPEKQPYIPPTFFHPKSSTTFNNNNNNNSSFGETTNQNFGEYQTYQKRPPFEFFTRGGSVTVNTANTKPIPAFKGRCYSTSGHSISGRNVGDISFNETSETNASDTTFLSWGSRKLKCTKPPTGEPSRAPYNFVPKVRNITKIREDDIKSAKEYEKIYDFEEPLIVHGISDLVTIEMSEQKHSDKLLAIQNLNPWYWEELCKKSGKDIRRVCFDARVSKNLDIFLMFRQQILMNMKIMETIFDNDKKRHVGVYIESPSNERHNGMRAVVHPSRIGDLYGLKLQSEIHFVNLNAGQLKEIYKFLRAHVILVKCNDLRVIFYRCVVDANDLAAFCNNKIREKQIHEVYFEYGTTFRQRFSYLLSNICSTRIFVRALPTCSSPVNATNDFFANTDRRQNLIDDLEIDYAEQPFEDQICANFIKKNIKEKGKFAISIWRMRAPASKAKDLGAAFGPFNRQLAFHRIRGAGAWGYESV